MLAEILAHKRLESGRLPHEPFSAAERWGRFRATLTAPGLSVIAEVKRRSPSAGVLRAEADPASRAREYEKGGAAVVSVLTDERFFGGSWMDLEAASAAISLPTLCKDFIIDARQVYEAARRGASACLLIVAALPQDELPRMLRCVTQCGLDAMVEVHDAEELRKALDAGAEIIGVNNRNLKTMEVDRMTVERLAPRMPSDVVLVAESGYEVEAHFAALPARVDAVLVGSALMKHEDPATCIQRWRESAVARSS